MQGVRFGCTSCLHVWETTPKRVVDAPDDAYHPWHYFADCPCCGEPDQEQHAQERKLLKMWAASTGPKTQEGKAAVTRNIAGHPTREETLRTRFNALRHGLNSKVATYWPARPGKYAQCDGCEFLDTICATQTACLKRLDLMVKHQLAFENKDPSLLTEVRAGMQFAITGLIDDMLLAIAQEGVSLKTPKYTSDDKGKSYPVKFEGPDGREITVNEIHAHPLLRVLTDFLARNNLSLADLRMTPKVAEDEDVIRGQLSEQGADRQSFLEHQKQQTEALTHLKELFSASRAAAQKDPILVEYLQGEKQDG